MTTLQFTCTKCEKTFVVRANIVPKVVHCPQCGVKTATNTARVIDSPKLQRDNIMKAIANYRISLESGDVDSVRRHILSGMNVNSVGDGDTITPLMIASKHGHEKLVRELIALGAKINEQIGYPHYPVELTALELARSLKIVDMLCAAGANVDVQRLPDRKTLLMRAAEGGDMSAVELLLLHGASMNQTDKYGHNALQLSLIKKHPDIAELLLEMGSAPSDLRDALKMSIQSGYSKVEEKLMRMVTDQSLRGSVITEIEREKAEEAELTRVCSLNHAAREQGSRERYCLACRALGPFHCENRHDDWSETTEEVCDRCGKCIWSETVHLK